MFAPTHVRLASLHHKDACGEAASRILNEEVGSGTFRFFLFYFFSLPCRVNCVVLHGQQTCEVKHSYVFLFCPEKGKKA